MRFLVHIFAMVALLMSFSGQAMAMCAADIADTVAMVSEHDTAPCHDAVSPEKPRLSDAIHGHDGDSLCDCDDGVSVALLATKAASKKKVPLGFFDIVDFFTVHEVATFYRATAPPPKSQKSILRVTQRIRN